MQTPNFLACGVAVAASLLLSSCAKQAPPAQTIIVQMPAPTAKAADKAVAEFEETDESGEVDDSQIEGEVQDEAPTKKAATSKPAKNQLLDYYDELPAKHFADFGKVKRRSLLNRKGAIVDYKRNFIQIPGDGVNSYKLGHTRYFQMTLFPNGAHPYCAVSKIVWAVGSLEPGSLDLYTRDNGTLEDAGFEIYKLGQTGDDAFESAWLPREGLDIAISASDERDMENGVIWHFDRNPEEMMFSRIKN